MAMCFGAGYVFLNYKSNISKKEQIELKQKELITDKEITEKTNQFDIQITYPYIAGNDNFNKLSEGMINKQLSDFKTISLENDKAVKENDPEDYEAYPRQYSLYISYDRGNTEDENIVSIVFNISSFTGGAHGSNYFIALNYNLKDSKEIMLADIFSGQTGYLQKISDYCIKDLTDQITKQSGQEYTDLAWIKEGAGVNEENFSIFRIDKNTITFYFPQYQVASYAQGDFRVTMPLQ